MLRRIPHGAVYTVLEVEIVIIACIHGRRDSKS